MTGERWRRALLAGLALAVGLGLRVWFVRHGPRVSVDSLLYGDLAKNMLRHGMYGFSTAAGGVRLTLIRLPGYPLFLAACFRVIGVDHYGAAMYVQVLVDLWMCLLVAGTAERLYGRRAWWGALWLAVLCPFTANYVAAALTETLSVFCVAAAFHGLVRWRDAGMGMNRWVAVIGGALAYAVLLRPEQGLLAAAVVPAMVWMVWRGGLRLGPVVCAAVLVVLPLVPWTARNWRVFHVVEPLAPRYATDPGEFVPLAFQRWYRTWGVDFISTDQVYWNYDSDRILVTNLPARAFDSADQRVRTAALLDDYNQTTAASPALDARFAVLAEERVKAGFLRYYFEMPVERLLNMLFRPRTELLALPEDWWSFGKGAWGAVWLGILNLAYFAVAGWGLWRRGVRGAVGWAMVAFCVLRCAMLLTIDNSEPRYTLELFPVLLVWAGAVWGETAKQTTAKTNDRGSSLRSE